MACLLTQQNVMLKYPTDLKIIIAVQGQRSETAGTAEI